MDGSKGKVVGRRSALSISTSSRTVLRAGGPEWVTSFWQVLASGNPKAPPSYFSCTDIVDSMRSVCVLLSQIEAAICVPPKVS